MQSQAEADLDVYRTQIRDLEDNLDKEKKRVQILQLDMASKLQDISLLREEINQQKDSLQVTIKSREEDIQKLKRQVCSISLYISFLFHLILSLIIFFIPTSSRLNQLTLPAKKNWRIDYKLLRNI